MESLGFTRTNENLLAIVRGLDVSINDYILVVGGSGDQAFALLEYARKVLAVDINQTQVNYIIEQAKSLTKRDYESFLRRRLGEPWPIFTSPEPSLEELFQIEKTLTNYFDENRLDKIRNRLNRLEIRHENILCAIEEEKGFNKVYLSNVLSFSHISESDLKIMSKKIPVAGLIYITLEGRNLKESLIEYGLKTDFPLSSIAKEIENYNWNPTILKKQGDKITDLVKMQREEIIEEIE